jgi:alpha-N-arabinofuranosidase
MDSGRKTPYFNPHGMEDMRLAGFSRQDVRYHNNLFIGLKEPTDYGKPAYLQAAGNLFIKAPGVEIEEKDDACWLTIPGEAAKAPAEPRRLVTTEVLGKARVPGAPFERPDGTPYRLDTDYFGERRKVENLAPGPFRARGEGEFPLKVWPRKPPGVLSH